MKMSLISNPPYNMKWEHPSFATAQRRFNNCNLPPEKNANYAFILTALSMISDKAVFLLPLGVLSTEDVNEKAIRKYLIKKNLIEAVISCPDRMFEATSIPTCIIVFNKNKKTTKISFVDMKDTYEIEERLQNGQYGGASHEGRTYKKEVKMFTDAHMQKAMDSILNQEQHAGFSKTVSAKHVESNDYNLIPTRYIDIEEQKQEHRSYKDIVDDINRITDEKNACKLTINENLAKQFGFDIDLYKNNQKDDGLNKLLNQLGADKLKKQNYFTVSKNKNEIKFENNSKEILSNILILILQNWKSHIYYLNNEQNRYLAELRDALLPDLMSGEIDIKLEKEMER